MHRISVFKRKTAEVWRRFKPLFVVYFLFVIGWFASEVYRMDLIQIVDFQLGLGDGFVLSWQSSLFQDLIFFGTTGFLGLVLSTRLPHEENFDTRSNVLANALNVGAEAKRFVREALGDLMVYNESAIITIHIEKYWPDHNKVSVFCIHENNLRNMCSDQPFKFPVNAYVMPGPELDGGYGYLSRLAFEDKSNVNNNIFVHDGGVRNIDKSGFEYVNRLEIAPDGIVVQRLEYLIYCNTDNDTQNPDSRLFFKSLMFTENLNVRLVNKSGIDLKYEFSYPDRRKDHNETQLRIIAGRGKVLNQKASYKRSMRNEGPHVVIKNKYMYRQDRFELSIFV
ncbi:hypothetical protein [Dyadobacter fanqingshengii]|uniref:Uncharacterized protein n=1 Tax=Dyadobacter fanqingshengii TaxID=2906443 RepID=A0A9X1TJ59_9BACT|nr:hypothetical protein [Dyadobacter fanqingshengii]MCF0043657.1 hypothetical protein [Dyadobacter fanqingshengii]USJ34727.1 hypothetical protein NFI81_18690 [Dyadobacter fanqingshengii]